MRRAQSAGRLAAGASSRTARVLMSGARRPSAAACFASQSRRTYSSSSAAAAATASSSTAAEFLATDYVEGAFTHAEVANRATEANLVRLATAFRRYGHRVGALDPLDSSPSDWTEIFLKAPELNPARYGLGGSSAAGEVDLEREVALEGVLRMPADPATGGERSRATLGEVIEHLRRVYCGSLCAQFSYIASGEARRWFAEELEMMPRHAATGEVLISDEEKLHAFRLMHAAERFDHFMAKKFPQVKRYALEGAEAMMPAVDAILAESAAVGVKETVIGMPHRGRLNLLLGLLDYPAAQLFWKVAGNREWSGDIPGIGDVISHLGTEGEVPVGAEKSRMKVALLQNPSHLEAINPVCLGKVRAKQDLQTNFAREDELVAQTLPLQLHGDAAFYGQGVVAESFGFSKLEQFTTHGSVHVIVNNQIGFTAGKTAGRSSLHSADIGKLVDVPAIHVNAESIGDVVAASRLAARYRQRFGTDVIVDLIGYRRHGHNELDEPSFTNPKMYKTIRAKSTVVHDYGAVLEDEGLLDEEDINRWSGEVEAHLQAEHARMSAETVETATEALAGRWKDTVFTTDMTAPVATGVNSETLLDIAKLSVDVPTDENVEVHQRLKRTFIKSRLNALDKDKVDWATAEAMAMGSMLLEGRNVRLCGQDAGRGTFSHRHWELTCQETEKRYMPLNHLAAKTGQSAQGRLEVVNSPLSEFAVLGFEYGYSLEDPNTLVLWEAQFGDFANGAQIVIDTFISCGESKWLDQSGIVLLLPHGMDGAGPEHSSGRPERFLQMCDDTSDYADPVTGQVPGSTVSNVNGGKTPNMHICSPTTPANYFHMMRRQMARDFRKPLVVMGPKTMIRLPAATSPLADLAEGSSFQPVIGDSTVAPEAASKVIFCSGKVYYDLAARRDKQASEGNTAAAGTAIVRLEELCPFPVEQVREQLGRYSSAGEFVWVQEEPQNAGAFNYVSPRMQRILPEGKQLTSVVRPPLPTSAIGVTAEHKQELAALLEGALP